MLGTFSYYFASAVTITVHLGLQYSSKFLIRQCVKRPGKVVSSVASSVASVVIRESIKSKFGYSKKKKTRRSKRSRWAPMAMTGKGIFSLNFNVFKRNKRIADLLKSDNDVLALDAAVKYKKLAEKRLDVARASFEAAALELRAAERGLEDAEKYYESLESYFIRRAGSRDRGGGDDEFLNDFVFVERVEEDGLDENDRGREAAATSDVNSQNMM